MLVVAMAMVRGWGWRIRMAGLIGLLERVRVNWSRGGGHSALVVVLLVSLEGSQLATPSEHIEGLQKATSLAAVFAVAAMRMGCGAAGVVFLVGGVCAMLWVRCLGGGEIGGVGSFSFGRVGSLGTGGFGVLVVTFVDFAATTVLAARTAVLTGTTAGLCSRRYEWD